MIVLNYLIFEVLVKNRCETTMLQFVVVGNFMDASSICCRKTLPFYIIQKHIKILSLNLLPKGKNNFFCLFFVFAFCSFLSAYHSFLLVRCVQIMLDLLLT